MGIRYLNNLLLDFNDVGRFKKTSPELKYTESDYSVVVSMGKPKCNPIISQFSSKYSSNSTFGFVLQGVKIHKSLRGGGYINVYDPNEPRGSLFPEIFNRAKLQ